MAVHDTEENQKTNCTRRTIESLFNTVDRNKHRIIIVNNNPINKNTKNIFYKLRGFQNFEQVIL